MGYTPENERIEDSVENLLEGLSHESIDALRNVARAREDSGDWDKYHVDELYSIVRDLESVRRRLKSL